MLSLAAMLIARGDAQAASGQLQERLQLVAEHRFHLATALDLLIDACLRSGDVPTAATAADHLSAVVGGADSHQLAALAAGARGRVLIAQGASEAAATELRSAVATLTRLELPFELAHAQHDLGRALTDTSRDAAIDHLRRSLPVSSSLAPSSTPIAWPPSSARWVYPLVPAPRVAGSSPIASNRCSGSCPPVYPTPRLRSDSTSAARLRRIT
jgi:hypothetical protein